MLKLKAMSLPFTVPVNGTSPRSLIILPVGCWPCCVNCASDGRVPIGVSIESAHEPVTPPAAGAAALAGAAAAGAEPDFSDGVVEQAAASMTSAAQAQTRNVFIVES